MVVQLSEAQVFVGEETQVLQRVLYGRGTGGYRLQELAQPLRIDGLPSFEMRLGLYQRPDGAARERAAVW